MTTEAIARLSLGRLALGDHDGAISMLSHLDGTPSAAREAILGMALLAASRPAEARAAFATAIRLGDGTPVTALNHALAMSGCGERAAALIAMFDLVARFPGSDEVHLRLADCFRDDGDLRAAEAEYRAAIDIDPARVEALLGLSGVLLRQGDPSAARPVLLRCCELAPDSVQAWDGLGLACSGLSDPLSAESAYAAAQRLAPGDIGLALRRSEAAVAAGFTEAELGRLVDATAANPLDIAQLTARGVMLIRLGRRDEAVDILEAAAALAPNEAIPAIELAGALIHTSRHGAAEAALTAAIALAPEQWLLRNNRAVVLMRLHRFREAHDELAALMHDQGEQPGLLCNLSTVLTALGEQTEGLEAARRACELAPRMHTARRACANALVYCDGAGGKEILQAGREVAAVLDRGAPPAFEQTRDPDRRLRVGLLSPLLKTHPVGWLTVAGFEHLAQAEFELVCIAQPESGDPIARRFHAAAAEWHLAAEAGPTSIAAQARDLRIDLLIDLSGYGDHGLMSALAYRGAPVQIKWVGMQSHSTGMPEMDWFVTDRWETPAGSEPLYSERLLRLDDGYVCYSPPPYAPDVAAAPSSRTGRVTFGCFNNLAKITPAVIAVWSEILARTPQTRLVLKTHQFSDPQTSDRVLAAFAANGVAPGRVTLRGGSPHRELLTQYADIDIVLDPFPYTGGLTTCEALWQGVPTITLAGETFSARHATSHLCNAGLGDWVTTSREAYVAMAIARSREIEGLAELRARLRSQVKASPLCDAARFGRSLGSALRTAWQSWCAA